MKAIVPVTGNDIERVHARLALMGDPRDLLAARDSIKRLLGVSLLES